MKPTTMLALVLIALGTWGRSRALYGHRALRPGPRCFVPHRRPDAHEFQSYPL